MSTHMARLPFSRGEKAREGSGAGIADLASYWLIQAGIYLTLGLLFYYSAHSKLIDDNGEMPAGLAHSFQGTFVTSFPGTNTAWLLIGILEAIVFVGIALSVLTGEFMPNRTKPILLTMMGLAMFTFGALAWGENMTSNTENVGNLFQYVAGTAVMIVLVLIMPPYRRSHWLTELFAGAKEDRQEAGD